MQITIKQKDLAESLTWLRQKHRKLPVASLEVFMGIATITCGVLQAAIPCTGNWKGQVSFNGSILYLLAKAPLSPVINLSIDNDVLKIGELTTPATWSI